MSRGMVTRHVHVNVILAMETSHEDPVFVALRVTRLVQDLVEAGQGKLVPSEFPDTKLAVLKVLATMLDLDPS